MRHKYAFFLIVLLCCTLIITTTHEPVVCQSTSTLQNGMHFWLNVTKTVKPKEVQVNQNVTVTIEIKNPENVTNANTTVYDLKVTEESLPFWSFTKIDAGNLSVIDGIELGVKDNVTGYYVLRPEKSGNMTLPEAKIEYDDINGTHYETFTEPVKLNVLPKIATLEWRNVLLLTIFAIGIPGVPWTLLFFSKRKTYIRKKKRK